MKDRLDIHEEMISNANSDEAFDLMNDDIENATFAINLLTDEVSKFKVEVNAQYKNHADIINKLSVVLYNLDSELFDKAFNSTEGIEEKQK